MSRLMKKQGGWLLCAVALLLAAAGHDALAVNTYVESGGVVVGEAEVFSSRTTSGAGTQWVVVPDEAGPVGGAFTNARGAFVQTQPDVLANGGPNQGALIDYQMHISTPGAYRLWNRYDGHDGASDSAFFSIVELQDGAGGTSADWYEDTGHQDANFATNPWDGSGGFEQNQAGASQNPMVWDVPSAGHYTLRVSHREDGVALDAFVFQLANLPAPTGMGPAASEVLQAESVTSVKDAFVRLGNGGDDNNGAANDILVKNAGGTSSTNRKGYLQFDVSQIDLRDLRDAKITLELTVNNAGGGSDNPLVQTVNVFGLRDGVNEGWIEGMGESNVVGATPPNPIVWDNAPGNDTGSGGGVNSDAVLLGMFDVPALNPDDEAEPILVTFTSEDLVSFMEGDSDGLVTFILTRATVDGNANLGFASREHPNALAPTLKLLVNPIPEPTTAGLALLGLAGLVLRRRRAA